MTFHSTISSLHLSSVLTWRTVCVWQADLSYRHTEKWKGWSLLFCSVYTRYNSFCSVLSLGSSCGGKAWTLKLQSTSCLAHYPEMTQMEWLECWEYSSNHKYFTLHSQTSLNYPPKRSAVWLLNVFSGIQIRLCSGNTPTPSKDPFSLRTVIVPETQLLIISKCSTLLLLLLRYMTICFAAVVLHARCNPRGALWNTYLQSSLMFLPFQRCDAELG